MGDAVEFKLGVSVAHLQNFICQISTIYITCKRHWGTDCIPGTSRCFHPTSLVCYESYLKTRNLHENYWIYDEYLGTSCSAVENSSSFHTRKRSLYRSAGIFWFPLKWELLIFPSLCWVLRVNGLHMGEWCAYVIFNRSKNDADRVVEFNIHTRG